MFRVMDVVVSGPLGAWAQGLADYLAGLGYAPTSIGLRLRLFAHLSRWLEAEGLASAHCDGAAVTRFLVARRSDHQDMSTPGELAPLLRYLRSAGVVPEVEPLVSGDVGPVDVVLARWGEFLAQERGMQAEAIGHYRDRASPFLVARLRGDVVDFDGVDARVVSEFVRDHIPGLSIGTAKLTLAALRSLLRFLFIAGLVSQRLDAVVPARAGYRDSGLPRGLNSTQLEALLSAIDLGSRAGIRDRAIVLLLSRLGLRAGEVAAVSVDDFDWRAGTVRVRGKGGQIDVLPLPADVGAAIAAYLQHGRHVAMVGRAVFFGSQAPYLPLNAGAVTAVVGSAGRRAGLGPVGAHQLRHGVATSTINAGASLEEVAQLLRHRSLASTTIYAKVDLTRLATLVRPWPDSTGGSGDGVL